jgi:hypothetical protein
MTMNKKLIGVVIWAAGFAGVGSGCATSPARLESRGMVASTVPGTWAIVAGPRTVHAYAAFGGGEVYNAPVTTGTNADCALGGQSDVPAVTVPADKVVMVTVSAGQMACLRTRAERGYELLWHAVEEKRAAAELVATAGTQRNGGRQ